jgi:integrase
MIPRVNVRRAASEATIVVAAVNGHLDGVTPSKRPSTQRSEARRAKSLATWPGRLALAALTPDIAASFGDKRLSRGESVSTVGLGLALLGYLYTAATREWGLGLVYSPVANVRRPSPGQGRNHQANWKEARRLLTSCDAHSNPMLGWIVRIALYTGMRQGKLCR